MVSHYVLGYLIRFVISLLYIITTIYFVVSYYTAYDLAAIIKKCMWTSTENVIRLSGKPIISTHWLWRGAGEE